ncbi:MAG TPA: DUF2970 domain-containing protein [Gammaproteobacteria bacterium]
MHQNKNNNHKENISFLNVLQSTLAAAFGVQSEKNRQRDFTHGKASTFIIAGIIFVTVFVLSVYGVVQLVLATASK